MLAGLGHALAALQDRREALRVADDLQRLRADKGLLAYEIGVIHAALGDRDHAFRWLTRAVRERSPSFNEIAPFGWSSEMCVPLAEIGCRWLCAGTIS
jgi:hypothetical protein